MTQQAQPLAKVSSAFAPVDKSGTVSSAFGDLARAGLGLTAQISEKVKADREQQNIETLQGDLDVDKTDTIVFDTATAEQEGGTEATNDPMNLTNIAAAIKQGSISSTQGKAMVQKALKQATLQNPSMESQFRSRAASFYGQYGLGEGLLDNSAAVSEYKAQSKAMIAAGKQLQAIGFLPFGEAMGHDPSQWETIQKSMLEHGETVRKMRMNEQYVTALETEKKGNTLVQQQAVSGYQWSQLATLNSGLQARVDGVTVNETGELQGIVNNIDAVNVLDSMLVEATAEFDAQYDTLQGQFKTYNQAYVTRITQLRALATGETTLDVVTKNNQLIGTMAGNEIAQSSGQARMIMGLMEIFPRMQFDNPDLALLTTESAQNLSKELRNLMSGQGTFRYDNVSKDPSSRKNTKNIVNEMLNKYKKGDDPEVDKVPGELVLSLADLEEHLGTSITDIFTLASHHGEIGPEYKEVVKENTSIFVQELVREVDNLQNSDPARMALVQLVVDPTNGTMTFQPASNVAPRDRSRAYRTSKNLNVQFKINETLTAAATLQGMEPNQLDQWKGIQEVLGEHRIGLGMQEASLLSGVMTPPTRTNLARDTEATDITNRLETQLDFLERQGQGSSERADNVRLQLQALEPEFVPADPVLQTGTPVAEETPPVVEDFADSFILSEPMVSGGTLQDSIKVLIDKGMSRGEITDILNTLVPTMRK